MLLPRNRLTVLSILCLLFLFAGVATAQVAWKSAVDGDYHIGTNWVGDAVPTTSQNAQFNIDGSYEVTFEETGTFSNNRLLFNSGDVTFDLDGKTLSITDPTNPSHSSEQPFTVSGTSGPAFTLLNGTIAVTTRGTIGRNNQSGSLTIGSGGIMTFGSDFLPGQEGTGTLLIEDGGKLTTGRMLLGHRNGGNGTVTVTGVGSSWAWSNTVTVQSVIGGSDSGTSGTLNVLNGGVATGTSAVTIATGAGTVSGKLLVSGTGSRFTIGGTLSVGKVDGTGSALIEVTNNGRVEVTGTNSFIDLRASAMLTGNGAVRVANSAQSLQNAGIVRPGLLNTEGAFTGGILNIEGNYTQAAAGILNINLGGTAEGDYGVIEVSGGTATLNGVLDVAVVNSFAVDWDQFFHILRLGTGGSMTGQFTGLDDNALVGTFDGVNLYITYDPESFGASSGGVGLYSVIPEPHTYALMFGTLIGLFAISKRRKITN